MPEFFMKFAPKKKVFFCEIGRERASLPHAYGPTKYWGLRPTNSAPVLSRNVPGMVNTSRRISYARLYVIDLQCRPITHSLMYVDCCNIADSFK